MFKRRIFILACVFFTLAISANAQKYYYFQGKKIDLTIDSTQLIIVTNNNFHALPNSTADLEIVENNNGDYIKKATFSSNPSETAYTTAINSLKSANGIKRVLPTFKRGNSPIGVSDLFYVKLNNQNDFAVLQNIAQQKGVTIVKQIPNMPLWYILQMQDGNNADYLDIVNSIYETGLFAASAPDFLFNFLPMCNPSNYNDPKFGEQDYLRSGENTGVGIGIHACDAWDMATGKGVKVAVVDKPIWFAHPDLIDSKYGAGYNTETYSSPTGEYDPYIPNSKHGTQVAGFIAARMNNNYGVIGVAPESQIIGISNNLSGSAGSAANLAAGISWAADNGADVINNSWGDKVEGITQIQSQPLEEAISYALTHGRNGKGCVVVFPSLYWEGYGLSGATLYPASCNDGILVAGFIAMFGCPSDIPTGIDYSQSNIATYNQYTDNRIDVVAPGGMGIITTNPDASQPTTYVSGVSFSAAIVSGVAALVLNRNPSLTGEQVKCIIKSTADNSKGRDCLRDMLYPYFPTVPLSEEDYKRYYGDGLVNAYAAVMEAENENSPCAHIDLLVRDNIHDDGTEPTANYQYLQWNSPDISLADYQFNPIPNNQLSNYTSCYVKVKIHNIGNQVSTGHEKLHVYWSRSSFGSLWNSSWTGADPATSGEITGQQGGVYIPALLPHDSITLYSLWNLPNNSIQQVNKILYNNFDYAVKTNWGFGILVRLEDGNDTYGLNENSLASTTFAQYSNNVAVSNGNLLNYDEAVICNVDAFDATAGCTMTFNQLPTGDRYVLNDFAELYALLSNDLMEKLDVNSSKGIKVIDQNRVFLTSTNSELHFAPLDKENEKYFIGAQVHFISDKMPELNEFNFDITYKPNDKNAESMRFTAVRDENIYFKAHAEVNNPKVVKAKEEVTLTANQIIADAKYIWHDEADNIIGEGYQITLIPDYSQTYKIEIEQKDNGYKSYDEVQVIVVDGVIKSLAPNPANDYVTVSYLLSDNATDASIQISNIYGNISASYPLAINMTKQLIPLSGLMPGTYLVKLLINGTVVDSKNLLKQ